MDLRSFGTVPPVAGFPGYLDLAVGRFHEPERRPYSSALGFVVVSAFASLETGHGFLVEPWVLLVCTQRLVGHLGLVLMLYKLPNS